MHEVCQLQVNQHYSIWVCFALWALKRSSELCFSSSILSIQMFPFSFLFLICLIVLLYFTLFYVMQWLYFWAQDKYILAQQNIAYLSINLNLGLEKKKKKKKNPHSTVWWQGRGWCTSVHCSGYVQLCDQNPYARNSFLNGCPRLPLCMKG